MKKKTVSRILAVMLSAGLMFAMAGCGGGAKDSADNSGKSGVKNRQARQRRQKQKKQKKQGRGKTIQKADCMRFIR